MDHQDARALFSDYLEGELAPAQNEQLAAHLEGCGSCRAELEALRRTLGSLARLPAVAPPREFARKVQERIRRRSRGRFFGAEAMLTRVPYEWISFLIIMLMILMYFMVLQGQSKRVAPAPPTGQVFRSLTQPPEPPRDGSSRLTR